MSPGVTGVIMSLFINVEKARATFKYCPDTGELKRKNKAAGSVTICGAKNSKKRYIRVGFDGNYFYAHRIIWAIVTGKQPDEIDHIDGNGLNNNWSNLRNTNHKINGKNQKTHTTNTSGYSGVTYRKDSMMWRARIMVNNEMLSLGTYKTKSEAINARKEAEQLYGFAA